MKKVILSIAVLAISYAAQSQKNWKLVDNEKTDMQMFTITENDSTGVKILLKDRLVEGIKVSKAVRRISEKFNGETFYKTLHYIVDGKVVPVDEVLYETLNPKDALYIVYDGSVDGSLWEFYGSPFTQSEHRFN